MSKPMGGPGAGVSIEKARDFKGTMATLLRYMGRFKLALAFVVLFAICSTLFNIVGPKILGLATTELFQGMTAKFNATGGINFEKIASILTLLLVLYGISACFGMLQGFLMSTVSNRVAYALRQDIASKINRLPLRYFESRTVGEVLSRITNDVDTLGQNLNQSLAQLVTSVVTVLGVIVMMLSINGLMTLVCVMIVPISLILIAFVVKKSQRYFKEQQRYLGEVNGQVEEIYSGHVVVKAFNREAAALQEFDRTNQILFSSAWKSQFLSGLMQPVMMFVGNLGYVVVAVVGSMLAVTGRLSVGEIQSFIQYVRNLTQPIMQLAQVSSMLQSMTAAAERVFAFLAEEEEQVVVENPATLEGLQGTVSFDHVRFGYSENKMIVQDFSCLVTPGQKVAIVGPTGAGKTTMVKLLMRFYDLNAGSISIDGNDICRYNRSQLREAFGMVLQETWLFKGTILENIRYGRLEATDDEVIAAAKAAYVHHFIKTLPGGYQMELNEDASNISQGQKQLLTIARAILADNRILILDEATSSVDTRTEVRIQKAMANLMQGRTSFVIAHRLSTIKDADVILVMKDGDIIEQGNHEQLLEQGGFYADLYNAQFEE